MRVVVVVGRWPSPGNPFLTFVKAQVDALTALGVENDVLVVRGPKGVKYLTAALAMARRARRGYDLVHAHYGYCGWVARCQLRCPVVVSFLGDDLLGTRDRAGKPARWSLWSAAANRWLARRVDAVIVKSSQMAEKLAPRPVAVIPNGVDFGQFRPIPREEACAALGLDPGARFVLFPADPRLPVKNFPLAAAAFGVARSAIGSRVEMLTLGGVDHDRVPYYFNVANAVLLTSFTEGSPNVVKEALACNAPVVSVDVGDVRDLLDGVDCCEIGPRDATGLGERLGRCLQDDRRSNGREMLRRRGLDSETVARRVLELYERVLRARSR